MRVAQAAPTFAQAMAKAVLQAAACWTQRQWRSPEVAKPPECLRAAHRLVVGAANSWEEVVAGAAESRAWSLPKERLRPGL